MTQCYRKQKSRDHRVPISRHGDTCNDRLCTVCVVFHSDERTSIGDSHLKSCKLKNSRRNVTSLPGKKSKNKVDDAHLA